MNDIRYLIIDNTTISYEIINKNKLRNITIRITIDGMKVSKPTRAKFEEVEKLLNLKSKWILKHFRNFELLKSEQYDKEWSNEDSILYQGQEYRVNTLNHNKVRTKIAFQNDSFVIYINEKLNSDEKKLEIKNHLKKYLKELARTRIENLTNIYAEKMQVKYKTIRIKEQKSIWGSCSRKGNLNFNWKLIMAPEFVLEYVVIHEMCHLKHMNHSKEFWNSVGAYMPNYTTAKQWLAKNGMRLGI